ncbi:MAG: hypothetical protein ACI9LE_001447 [Paraglaciecola sp.]|jgi:hypothetical protein
MLKIVNTCIATAHLLIAGNAQADVSEALQNICTIMKTDGKCELRKIKRVQSDFKLKDYYTGVSCVGSIWRAFYFVFRKLSISVFTSLGNSCCNQ